MLAAAVPVAAAGLLGQRVHQQDALRRLAGHDQPLHALEIPARLVLGVGRRARRERFEEAVAPGSRMAGGAPCIAFSRARQNRLHARLERLVIKALDGRRALALTHAASVCHSDRLRRPVLTTAVPVAATGLFRERIHQQDALRRLAGHDETLHPIEVPARLLVAVGRGAGRERLEKTVAAARE